MLRSHDLVRSSVSARRSTEQHGDPGPYGIGAMPLERAKRAIELQRSVTAWDEDLHE